MRQAAKPPRAHVYVFAKAPLLGAVKHRLAADIGDAAARRFYRDATLAALRRLSRDPRWRTWLAVTPDRFARRGRFWPRGVERIPQGEGDLGHRMARALNRFPGAPAVVVGSDIPDLDARHVARAFAALGRNDAVFGPSADGGFWLVGARDARRLGALFAGVRWSTPHALEDTLANLRGRRVAMVDRLDDVDDGEALARRRPGQVRPERGRLSAP